MPKKNRAKNIKTSSDVDPNSTKSKKDEGIPEIDEKLHPDVIEALNTSRKTVVKNDLDYIPELERGEALEDFDIPSPKDEDF